MNKILKPVVLFLRVTENCNAGCFMCDFSRFKNKFSNNKDVSKELINKIAVKVKDAEFKLVRFTGGEPLLHKNIFYLIKAFKSRGLKVSIITNGFLLPRKHKSLIKAGLDQLIISLDGSHNKIHDRLRNTPGLFENIIRGIIAIKKKNNNLNIRINTVVSPFNIKDLLGILNLLISLNIDQWSIIPLKSDKNLWEKLDQSELLSTYYNFQNKIRNISKPKLLGYSKNWAGRSKQEVIKYFTTGIPFTPKNKCRLVDLVRFYIPFKNQLLPCNCVPHRLEKYNLEAPEGFGTLSNNNSLFINYLRKFGSKFCKGCEPVNAYLAEHPNIIEKDILYF